MADEWRTSSWGDEITLEYGKALRGHDGNTGRYRVFGSNGPIGWTTEHLASGPGVILGRKGAYRGVHYWPEPFFVIDTAYYVVPKNEFDMRWLYYAIKHYKLGEIDDGSPIPSTTRAAVYVQDFEVPPLQEQCAMARVLGAFDDKIELNRRIDASLEALVQALFKSWLDELNVKYAAVSQLIDEGVLEIGDGYRAKNSELGSPGLPFIRAGDLNNGFDTAGAELLKAESVAKAGHKVSRVGDVAFTSKGTIGRFARVTEFSSKFVYSPQVCFWRSLMPSRLDPNVLYCWMQSDDLATQISAVAGQTDMAPYVSLRDQRRMQIPAFPESQIDVARQIDPFLKRQALLAAETKTLAGLRDTLLPKLLSGETRIADPARFLGRLE